MFPEKEIFNIQCASECIKMMGIWDMDSLCDKFKYSKELTDREVADQTKPVASKWLNMFGELQNINSFSKPENLLYLVKKTLSILCSTAFVKILSIMPLQWTDTIQKFGLVKTKLQVKMNFTFDSIPLCYHFKEGYLKGCKQFRKV